MRFVVAVFALTLAACGGSPAGGGTTSSSSSTSGTWSAASTSSGTSGTTGAATTSSTSTSGSSATSTTSGTSGSGSTTGTSASSTSGTTSGTSGTPSPLHVSGNHLVDASGNIVQLHGVNRSGTEYACIQGWGIFDGPNDDASVAQIAAWNANVVRVPLNEDCWLQLNGVQSQYGGATYKQAIEDYVGLLHSHGLYAILELHWSAPGSEAADGQRPMPDHDHAPAFWADVAATFGSDGATILELFNEPFPDGNQDTTAAWDCWQNGCTETSTSGASYQAAGMQELLNAVRGAGAQNVVLLGGVQYSNALSSWLAHEPTDSGNNLAAAWHVYNFNTCSDTTCYDQTAGPVAAQVPLVTTEIGEDDSQHSFIDPLMGWLDTRNESYLAWTWDTWGDALSLIDDYSTGHPASAYAQGYKDHLATRP